ncbi:hypothetical protein [Rhodovulum sp. PH10]|uniref:hypothetical protein n=1 Tax=Rhodovulum sp. PH10 TaxID=1187851 RepID=UPI0012FAB293|nr:hypothetical protein [Rhodovulum sp. PH10]
MLDQVSKEWITLIAAGIAAISGLVGVFLNIRNAVTLPQRGALRKILENDINGISSCIYLIVAYSKKMSNAKSDAAFRNFLKLAEEQRQVLNKLRSNARYSLWGLDQGFRELRSTPMYISHYKHSRSGKAAKKIIYISTRLRVSLDRAIIAAYVAGLPPGRWSRLQVWFWGWRLRTYFAKGRKRAEPHNS